MDPARECDEDFWSDDPTCCERYSAEGGNGACPECGEEPEVCYHCKREFFDVPIILFGGGFTLSFCSFPCVHASGFRLASKS